MNKDDEHNRNIQNSWNNDGQGIPKNVQAGKNANVQKTSEYATDECVTSSTEQTNNSKAELVTLALQSWSGILPPPELSILYVKIWRSTRHKKEGGYIRAALLIYSSGRMLFVSFRNSRAFFIIEFSCMNATPSIVTRGLFMQIMGSVVV